MFKKTSILILLIGLLLNEQMVRCNVIPSSGDPVQSIPFGSGGRSNVASQYGPNQNPSTGSLGYNPRPNYFESSPPLMRFPTSPNAMGFNQQPSFGAPSPYPYVALYSGNNLGTSQMLPYYGQFRPFYGGQASGGFGAYNNNNNRFQNQLQFGPQPQFGQQGQLTSSGANLPSLLFDRMDTAKQSDDNVKKPSE